MTIFKNWAPRCALPNCQTQVGYHKKYVKLDGSPGFAWKTFCEYHRTKGKNERDALYVARGGCENRDGRLGFKCKDHTTKSLTVDHWDGNKHNDDESNLVILCANCHQQKTKLFGDNMNRYDYTPTTFKNHFEF